MHADAPRFLRRPWLKPLRGPLQRPPEPVPVPAEAPAPVAAAAPMSLEAIEQMLDAAPARGPAVHEETVPAILWRGEQSAAEAAVDAPELPPPEHAAPEPLDAAALAALPPPAAPLDAPAPRLRPAAGGMALLEQRLSAALAEAQRRNGLGALVRLGVARLDEVGDAFGEAAVAQTLQQLGRRLSRLLEQVAAQATVHTLGDGMLVVLPRIERSTAAEAMVRQMLELLARPITLDGHAVALHASAGMAVFPHDGDQPAPLRRAAEVAWHQARARGRSAYQFYARELENRAARRLALEARLRQAIIDDELQLAFQPRAEVRSGALCGAEAVPVWAPDPEPLWQGAELLLLADESGLGEALAHWAVQRACRHLRAWHDGGLAAPQVSVPILPTALRQDRLVHTLLREVHGSGLQPAALTLLLRPVAPLAAQTPQRLGRELCSAMPRLQAYTDAGFRLALDGVASSACSLSALAQLPLAELRLDCQALAPIDDEAGTLRGAIVALGHRLQLRVAACGVEDEAELARLRAIGCDEFQGPLLSDPLDHDTWLEVLARTQQ
jgi:diguanylate cyclase (GGDEF)-like protein